MPLIMGILAQAAAAPVAAGAYDLLETQTLATTAASVTFTGLGSYTNYKHLQIRYVAKNTSNAIGTIFTTFNSDTGNNYATHRLFGTGSTVTSDASTSRANLYTGNTEDSASSFAGGIIDILDFASTSKNTTTRTLTGIAQSSSVVGLHSGVWLNTNAVTTITLTPNELSFDTGSRFSIFGIKAA